MDVFYLHTHTHDMVVNESSCCISVNLVPEVSEAVDWRGWGVGLLFQEILGWGAN